MKAAVLGLAALGVAAAGVAMVAARAGEAPAPDLGQQVYASICQGCHMAQGEGAIGAGEYPKLAGNPRLVSWQYVALTVLQGRRGMPSFGVPNTASGMGTALAFGSVNLSDEEVAAVVNYVRSHFGNDYKDKATPKEVQALPHPGQKGSGRAG